MTEMTTEEIAQEAWETANRALGIAVANTQLIAMLTKHVCTAAPELNEALLAGLKGLRQHAEQNQGCAWVFDVAISAIDDTHPAPDEPQPAPPRPQLHLVHDADRD